MRIATTFWLCIGALVLGYLATVTLNSVLSRRNEALLERTAGVMFPSAQRAQAAQADFKRQLLAYQDAVVIGDAEALDKANAIAAEVRLALEEILAAEGLDQDRRSQAQALVSTMVAYAGDARTVYGPLANGETDAALMARAAELNAQGETLLGLIEDLSADLSADLRTIISLTISATVRQRAASEIAFALIVLATLAVITVIIERWARRLDELMYASSRLTQGDYACEISGRGSDELGRLAQAFHEMRNAMAQRDQDLRRFNETLEAQVQERTHEVDRRSDDLEQQIVQRRRAEQSLRLLEAAVGELPDGMVITTSEADPRRSRIEYANPAFAALLGVSVAESRKLGIATLCSGGGVAPMTALVGDARNGLQTAVVLRVLLGSDVVPLSVHAAPVRDDRGAVTGIVYLIRRVESDAAQSS